MHLRHDHVGRAILVEQHPPPAAAGPAGLGDVEQQRIDARAGRPDIIDRAVAGAEARPGLLPFVARFEALEGRAGQHDRDDQHRRRAADRAADPEQLAGAGAVEQDAERGDVALRADLLLLDDDPGDHRVERGIGEARRLADRAAVGLRPERLPALRLGLPPALVRAPCRHCRRATSTSIPPISNVLALSIGGTPRSAPSSCA